MNNKQSKKQIQISKIGKASKVTLGYVLGKQVEGGATRAMPFIREN